MTIKPCREEPVYRVVPKEAVKEGRIYQAESGNIFLAVASSSSFLIKGEVILLCLESPPDADPPLKPGMVYELGGILGKSLYHRLDLCYKITDKTQEP